MSAYQVASKLTRALNAAQDAGLTAEVEVLQRTLAQVRAEIAIDEAKKRAEVVNLTTGEVLATAPPLFTSSSPAPVVRPVVTFATDNDEGRWAASSKGKGSDGPNWRDQAAAEQAASAKGWKSGGKSKKK